MKKNIFDFEPALVMNEGDGVLINFDVEPVKIGASQMGGENETEERDAYACYSIRVKHPLDYGKVVNAIIGMKYAADIELSVVNNHITNPTDAHEAAFAEYQQWRGMAKKVAKEALGIEMTQAEIVAEKAAEIDAETDRKILRGHVWNGNPVWLSSENQFNYKAAFDLSVQTDGQNLPITFKLGEKDGENIYHTFESVEELQDFYVSCVEHINQCLKEGWTKKEALKAE